MKSAAEYFQRFGEPGEIRLLKRDGDSFYEFRGGQAPHFMAAPSSAPAYVFDSHGRFIEWCKDPGDAPSWRLRWPVNGTNKLDVAEVKRRFGI
jgi:hypothetical protein